MNLSKITLSVASFLTIVSLSTTCAVAGTADIVKKQMLQQLKLFQSAQSQHGKPLKKAASGSKEITVADSVETYSWENASWTKSGCTRYSYDSKGRIKEEAIVDEDGSDSKNSFEYDPDGKTIKNTSIWNFSIDGELLSSDTTYSIFKYYPGYTDAIIQSNLSEYALLSDIENVMEYYGLDSLVTIALDGSMDTTYKSLTSYTKSSDKIVHANVTLTSMSDEYESMSYSVDYIYSGNGVLDTLKWIFHFDSGLDSLYTELLSGMQYMMVVSKTDQSHVVEQTVLSARDSTFANYTNESKVTLYTSSNGGIDSMVTQEWDTLAQVWQYIDKSVYTIKKITVGVNERRSNYQPAQHVTFDRKNGTLHLNIPNGMTVSHIEQLDLQGKVISRSAVTNAKNSIVLNSISKNSSTVNLVRLKTDKGDFTCKINRVK